MTQPWKHGAAILAALSLATIGTSPLFASSDATTVARNSVVLRTPSGIKSTAEVERELRAGKERVQKLAQDAGRAGERAKRVLKVLDILLETDRAERHRLIGDLPVRILRDPGPGGTYLTAFVEGKFVKRLFVAETRSGTQVPSLPEQREANDRPDGGFEATPPVVSSATDLCEDENGWSECATTEDLADGEALALYQAYSSEQSEAEGVAYEAAVWDCYENNNCIEPTPAQTPDGGSGENALPACVAELQMAIGAAAASGLSAWSTWTYIRSAANITRLAVIGLGAVNGLILVGAIGAISVAAYCAKTTWFTVPFLHDVVAWENGPREFVFRP